MPDAREKVLKLLVSADNFVKYAAPGREERGAKRARKRYEQAALAALKIGDEELHARATRRLADLDAASLVPVSEEPSTLQEVPPPPPAATDADLPSLEPKPPAHAAGRVPPGQRVTSGWPVLHEGPIPRFDPFTWRLRVEGLVQRTMSLSYEELKALGPVEVTADMHCVTGWSRLDNAWVGIQTKKLLGVATPKPNGTYVSVGAERGYTANMPLEVLLEDDALLAWGHDGAELEPKHGWPLRLVVPKLYAWKSVKWVRSLEVLEMDRRGFWELRGYHNDADPWREERYSYQER